MTIGVKGFVNFFDQLNTTDDKKIELLKALNQAITDEGKDWYKTMPVDLNLLRQSFQRLSGERQIIHDRLDDYKWCMKILNIDDVQSFLKTPKRRKYPEFKTTHSNVDTDLIKKEAKKHLAQFVLSYLKDDSKNPKDLITFLDFFINELSDTQNNGE